MKKTIGLFLVLLLTGISAFAQTKQEVSDEELKLFATAFQEVRNNDQQAQKEMVKAIQQEGLEVQRFNEIQKAQQDPNEEMNANNSELEGFQAAITALEKIQGQAQKKMQKSITETGLTVPRYQEIATTVQTDPDLQQKLQEYL